MINWTSIGLGVIAGSFVAGIVSWQLAFDRGLHKGKEVERENAKVVVAGLIKEKNDAVAQIDKINADASARIEALAADFVAEGASRLAAQKSMEQAVKASSVQATQAWSTVTSMRATLQTVSDECARSGADPAIVGMFNELIATSFKDTGGNVRPSSGDPRKSVSQSAP